MRADAQDGLGTERVGAELGGGAVWPGLGSANPVFSAQLCIPWGLLDTWTRFWNSVPSAGTAP